MYTLTFLTTTFIIILLSLWLLMPLARRAVSLANRIRKLLRDAAMDTIQVSRAGSQARLDTEQAQRKLETDTDRADIETRRQQAKLEAQIKWAALQRAGERLRLVAERQRLLGSGAGTEAER